MAYAFGLATKKVTTVPHPASATQATEAEQDEFGAWLVVREVTDVPTLTRAVDMLKRPGRPAGEVQDWYRRGLLFVLTDPATPPPDNVAAAAVFLPISEDALELAAVAVVEDYGEGLRHRLLEPVSHILAARGVARIVVRRVPVRPAGAGGQDWWSEPQQ